MSHDSSIPSGGSARPTTGTKSSQQTDARKVKGKFEASGGSREVSRQEGKTHIPAATANRPKERPLDDWEVKIQQNEQLFFTKADDILGATVRGLNKEHLRNELKTLHTCMTEIVSEYSQRISALTATDRILEKHHQEIKGPMIRVFHTVKDELVKLDKSLALNASKATSQEVKDVLPIAQNQIKEARQVLAKARTSLIEATLPDLPEKPDLADVKVHPVPKAVARGDQVQPGMAQKKRFQLRKKTEPEASPSVETVSPEQRLQNLRVRLQKASPDEVPEIFQHMASVLEKLGHRLEEHIKQNPDDPKKKQFKENFDRSLDAIRRTALGKIASDNVSRLRQGIKDHLFICEQCIKGITGWQGKVVSQSSASKQANKSTREAASPQLKKAENAHLAASEISFKPLHEQVGSLNSATSEADRTKELRALDHCVRDQLERFSQLLPLFQGEATGADVAKREPSSDHARFHEAMNRLANAMRVIQKKELSRDYFSAVKEADAALQTLDALDRKLLNAHLATSEIQFEPLHKQVETLNLATSAADRSKALRELDSFISGQRDRFNRLLPLFQAIATKCDFEKKDPPPECTRFYEAMSSLNKVMLGVNKKTLSSDYFAAVKEANAALKVLDTFDQQLPAALWHSLTETVGESSDATPHFMNLMCRRILNEETGLLSERASLQKLTDICTYLDKVQEGKLNKSTHAEILQAFQKVVGDGFSSPDKVKALMGHARTLEEVRAVGFQLVNWTDMQNEFLDSMCKKLERVSMDLELEDIQKGRDHLNTLTSHFTSGTERVAHRVSASRLSLFEAEVKSAVELIVKERVENPGFLNQFRSDKTVCEKLQQELNRELGNVATIKLTPSTTSGELLRRVEVKLGDTEEDSQKINATLNGTGKHATQLRSRLLAGSAKKFLEFDESKKTYHWEPHPKKMIRKFADDFVSGFDSYQKAVNLARKHERRINRLVVVRDRVDSQLEQARGAIPSVRQLKIKTRKRSKKRRATAANLQSLTTQVARLKGKPLKRLADETTPIRNLVVNMLRGRQLDVDEAIVVLGPLYTIRQTAKGTTPALQVQTQPLSAEKVRRTETLQAVMSQLDKKYRSKSLWHRLTRRKRLKTIEHARALVAICEACPQAPVANAQMLDGFLDEMKRIKNPHPDYKDLMGGLRDYALHLQKSSVTMTFEQARG